MLYIIYYKLSIIYSIYYISYIIYIIYYILYILYYILYIIYLNIIMCIYIFIYVYVYIYLRTLVQPKANFHRQFARLPPLSSFPHLPVQHAHATGPLEGLSGSHGPLRTGSPQRCWHLAGRCGYCR